MMKDQIKQLETLLDSGERIVFFSGAGVSTDSGIPDFRSQDGLYSQNYPYPPEEIISRHFFDENPEEFYRFYKDRMLITDAEPNATHRVMALLEKRGKCSGVVTQNIDGLHIKAGSVHVDELHGSVLRNTCMGCGRHYDAEFIKKSSGIPRCPVCGNLIKPDVVLYEEPLDDAVVSSALQKIGTADILVVLGTSLVVYPAAGLIRYFKGRSLVLINRTGTPYDHSADLLIRARFSDLFPVLEAHLTESGKE